MNFFNKLFGGGSTKSSSGPPAEQLPFLKNMWQAADTLRSQQEGQLAGMNVGGIAGGLAQQGQQYTGTLAQGGQALAPFAQQGFGGQQIAGLQSLLNNNLQRNLLPQISDAAQLSGGFGGGGMGVAQGVALGDTQRALFEGAGGIMQADLMRQQQAAGQMGGQQLAGNQAALSGLGGLYDLQVNQPLQSMFMPLVSQGGINSGYNTSTSTNRQTGGVLPAFAGLFSGG